MPRANERLLEDIVDASENTKDDAERIYAVASACDAWRVDVETFRDQLVKEGSASLLVEFDKVEKKFNERLDHINTGRDNSTSNLNLYGVIVGIIIVVPWFVGVKSFFS